MKTSDRINWKEWDSFLGTMPDTDLAKKIGCTLRSVANRRRKLNIHGYNSTVPKIDLPESELIKCACGCGGILSLYDGRKRPRKFLPGHWSNTQSKNRILMACDNCHKPIERTPYKANVVNHHFCNQKCEGEYSRKTGKRRGKNNGHYNTITVPCAGCGTEVSKAVSLIKRRNSRVYCPNCIPITRQGRKGFYVGYPKEFNPTLRHQIRKRDNFTCQNCGKHQDNTGTLHVHHIDYNKFNNDPLNLIALCVTCHGQTNWATEVWQEKFTNVMNHRSL